LNRQLNEGFRWFNVLTKGYALPCGTARSGNTILKLSYLIIKHDNIPHQMDKKKVYMYYLNVSKVPSSLIDVSYRHHARTG
jgi:hypothetical protein